MPDNPLEKVTAADVRIDRLGRPVVVNPEIAARVRELGVGIDDVAAAGNGLCCGNGQCVSEQLVSMLDRLVTGNR